MNSLRPNRPLFSPGDLPVREVWARFRQRAAKEERDQLVLHYLSVVRVCAIKLMTRLPKFVELDDLISAGTIGLIGAIETFDPDRGIAFATFASYRIRGAILDDLRAQDWVPRSAREGLKDEWLDVRAASPAVSAEESAEGEHPAAACENSFPRISPRTLPRIESLYRNETDKTPWELVDSRQDTGLAAVTRQDLSGWVLRQLRPADRRLLAMYHFEHMKLSEIASIIGVTESRISQRLRGMMAKLQLNARRLAA